MSELYRLEGRSHRGKVTLVLTATHVILEPDPEFRAELEAAMAQGIEGAQKAPGVIGWFVTKMVNFADRMVDKYFEPHPLQEVDLKIDHDRVLLKLGHLNVGTDLRVDPTEAYILDAKFRDAKAALR